MDLGDRPKRWLEWSVVGGVAAVAFVLGYLGFERQPGPGTTLDHLYRSLQLFWLEYGSPSEPSTWMLDAARMVAPGVLLYAAGRALVSIFGQQLRLLLPRRRKRVVICGLGRMGWLLARSFQASRYWVAVVERDERNEWIEACRDQGIPVVVGNATDPTRLRKARARRATYLIAVCGRDGTNADVAAHAQELVAGRRGRRGPLRCFAHVVDLELCHLLRARLGGKASADFELELFNIFETGAREWLRDEPPFAGVSGGDDRRRPHLVVVGVGQMGKNLVVGAATKWETLRGPEESLPRITLVDKEANRKRDSLRIRHPRLVEICDLVPIEIDVAWPEFEEAEFLVDEHGACDVTAIYVCMDDDARGVAAALALAVQVRDQQVPIVVRTTEEAGLAGLLHERWGDAFPLRAFPLLDRTCTAELILGETTDELPTGAPHDGLPSRERVAR
jgi:TrkA family protein